MPSPQSRHTAYSKGGIEKFGLRKLLQTAVARVLTTAYFFPRNRQNRIEFCGRLNVQALTINVYVSERSLLSEGDASKVNL